MFLPQKHEKTQILQVAKGLSLQIVYCTKCAAKLNAR